MPITDPTDIAGCQIWLDPSVTASVFEDAGTDAAEDGDRIAQINDQSGGGNHVTQTVAGDRPLYINTGGVQAICYDVTDTRILNFPGISINRRAFTAMIVLDILSVDLNNFPLRLGAAFDFPIITKDGIIKIFTSNSVDEGSTLRPHNGKQIIIARGNASNTVLYRDTLASAQNLTAFPAGSVTGGELGTSFASTRSNIYEFVIYDSDIGSTNVGDLIDYAIAKHGITVAASTLRIVWDGDSLTEGIGSTRNQNLPHRLAALLPAGRFVYPFGVSSQTINDAVADSSEITPLFAADGIQNWFFCKLGTNDLSGAESGADVYAEIVSYCNSMKTAGAAKVVVWTYNQNAQVTERDAANALLRADFSGSTPHANVFTADVGTNYADYLVDIAAHTNLGTGSGYSGTYFVDGVHLTDVGYQVEAQMIVDGIAALALTGSRRRRSRWSLLPTRTPSLGGWF